MKVCRTCNTQYPLSDFYKGKDGWVQSKCRYCCSRQTAIYKKTHREYYNRLQREATKTEAGKKAKAAAQKRYRVVNRRKSLAHGRVNDAIRRGHLIPWGCMACENQHAVAHHPDYSLPLDVVWLCEVHHIQLHKEAVQYKLEEAALLNPEKE